MPDFDENHTRDARELRALTALDDYCTKGTPFVLYLRKFHVDALHGAGDSLEYLDSQLVRSLSPGINVLCIQHQQSILEDQPSKGAFSRLSPGLRVGDNWQGVVSELIQHADMIVQELNLIADGTEWEMRRIHELQQNSKTVVIIPDSDDIYAPLDARDEIKVFGRCIHKRKVSERPLVESPQAADLVKRLRSIAEHPEIARAQPSADQPGNPPITYEGVVEGLMHEAELAEMRLEFGPDKSELEHIWHVAFWSRYRAVSILQVQAHGWKTISLPKADLKLVPNYLKIAEACAAHYSKRSFPDPAKQIDFGYKMLTNAVLTLERPDNGLLDAVYRSTAHGLVAHYEKLGFPSPAAGSGA